MEFTNKPLLFAQIKMEFVFGLEKYTTGVCCWWSVCFSSSLDVPNKTKQDKPLPIRGLRIKMLVSSQTGTLSVSMDFPGEAFSQAPC